MITITMSDIAASFSKSVSDFGHRPIRYRDNFSKAGRVSLLRSWAYQRPQRHQGSDGNVLVIHQMFLRERQRFHNGSCLVLGLSIDHEDDAFAITARIPLADFPVEVELHSCPNLFRYDRHDLLRGYALLGSLNNQHFGGFRYSHAGHA